MDQQSLSRLWLFTPHNVIHIELPEGEPANLHRQFNRLLGNLHSLIPFLAVD